MDFEWDEAKRKSNLVKHVVDFRQVIRIFDGDMIKTIDDRWDYGDETRINGLGEAEGRVYAVVYTWRGAVRRIISARKASERETKTYYSRVG